MQGPTNVRFADYRVRVATTLLFIFYTNFIFAHVQLNEFSIH